MTWQTSDTAPRDGTHIIVIPYGDLQDLQVSWFIPEEDRWANWNWHSQPSHWMPMPEPPAGEDRR